ncbi:cobalamin-5'-phosphate synthase [Natronorubrum sediminis]|uniref:Adenosylcobinamide-GDP ribazoletransferase n=1 Tax=Natronorubrum sediminis TaxID=640943 RepID=A0A1H6G2D4_9EURY|nr:adenosylcobinamide-GDP ribazoletransferase [Natronorubrum sediminis]SEH16144.1 cobalamin-5'-phosphate synthase [Natronorubrum sediminis]
MSPASSAALRGALAFLTRLPVTTCEGDWDAFRARPVVFPIVGAIAGAIAAIPLLAANALPAPTIAFGYLLAVYAVTGIHHLDGVADLGDAFVVHGDSARRREVLKDTTTGVGALLAVSLAVAGLALGALGVAALPLAAALAVVVAAEVGAKLGMSAMACGARASHDGMGSQFTAEAAPASVVAPAVAAVPVAFLSWPEPVAAATLLGATAGACLPWLWARRHLEGVTGDVFGAANEIGRLAGLHAGVIAWTLL